MKIFSFNCQVIDSLLYTQVNAITAALFTTDVLEKNSARVAPEKTSNDTPITDDIAVSIDEWSSGLEETDDSLLYFSPDLGNVVFTSAIDGWGFRLVSELSIKVNKKSWEDLGWGLSQPRALT